MGCIHCCMGLRCVEERGCGIIWVCRVSRARWTWCGSGGLRGVRWLKLGRKIDGWPWEWGCSVRHKVCCVSGLLELVWVHFISWVWCALMLLLRCVLDLGVVVKDGASWPGLEAICLRVRPSFRMLLAMCVPGACVLRKRVRSLIKLS